MRGKSKYLVLPITFLMLVNGSTSWASIKIGSPCSAVGAKKTFQGTKLICVKSGKKLIWSKNVSSSNPSSKVATTQQMTDNRWYPWSFRFNQSGKLERRGGPITNWSTDGSRPGQEIDPIRIKAFEEISRWSKQSTRNPLEINFFFSPNLKKGVAATYRKYFDLSISFFEAQIPQESTLDVVVGTELDDEYFQKSFLEILGNQKEANDLFQRNKGMIHQFDGEQGKSSSGGGTVGTTSQRNRFIYVGAVCSCAKPESLLMYNIPHEVTHFYQFAVTAGTPKQNFVGEWPNVTEGKIYLPLSLLEGSANTIGSALIVPHPGWYSDQMNWHLGRTKRRSVVPTIENEKQALELMQQVRSYLPEKLGYAELGYSLGQLIWEYFIAQYGIENYFKLYSNIETLRDFDEAMMATIQKTESDFYLEAAPYVLRAYNAVSK